MPKKTFKSMFHTEYCKNLLKNDSRPIIFYDLETTGINRKKDFIVQISAFKFRKTASGYQYLGEKFNEFIKAPIPIPEKVSKINHITNEIIKDEKTEIEIFPKIYDFFGDVENSIICGYNVSFDNNFMDEMYMRQKGINFIPGNIIDVLFIARELVERNDVVDKTYKLSSVGKLFGITKENMHSSDIDIYVTAKLLHCLMNEYKKIVIPDYDSRPKLQINRTSEFKKGKTTNYLMIYVTGQVDNELVTGHMHYDRWNYKYVEDEGNLFDRFDMNKLAKDVM